jgi:hypothetical protein
MLAHERELDTKILASYEILNYCKYLFDTDGFYRKSPKSEFALEIENNYKCGTNTGQLGAFYCTLPVGMSEEELCLSNKTTPYMT